MKHVYGKIYYGWIITFAGFLMIGLSVGLQVNCNVAFMKPMSEDMGFSISQIALNTSITSVVAIPCYIIIPKILKKISYRSLAVISGISYLIFKILFTFSTELWQFYLSSLMMGISIPGISFITVNSLVDGWFHEKRGLAIGITATGAGIIGAVFLPIITSIIEVHGWRNAYLLQTVVIFIMLTISLLLIRNNPDSVGLKPYGYKNEQTATIQKNGFTLKQTLLMPAFYMLLLGVICISIVGLGMQTYLMSCLSDEGYEVIFASNIVSLILIIATIGKIVMGLALDKFGIKYVGLFTGACFLISLILLIVVGNHILFAYIFAFAFGISYVTLSIPVPYLIINLFGSKDFTAIYGVALIVSSTGSTIGSILTGLIYDNTGSYQTAWIIYMFISIVLAVSIQIACQMLRNNVTEKKINLITENEVV